MEELQSNEPAPQVGRSLLLALFRGERFSSPASGQFRWLLAGTGPHDGSGGLSLYMACVTLFAFSNLFLLSFAILCVAGVGWSMMVTLNQTLLQLNVADAYRARTLSLYSMAAGSNPFGNLGIGLTADIFGVQAAVAGFALTALTLATVLGIGSADVRRL